MAVCTSEMGRLRFCLDSEKCCSVSLGKKTNCTEYIGSLYQIIDMGNGDPLGNSNISLGDNPAMFRHPIQSKRGLLFVSCYTGRVGHV